MKDFGLVVIGAHFGVWLENEINKFKGHNILLVEPVPYNIEILEKKYGEFDNIYICKNAIFSKKKTSSFYYVNGKSIHKLGKHWASGIGSFDKNHILNHKSKRFKIEDDDIVEMKMNFITFEDISSFQKIICEKALMEFLNFGYVPAPKTIFKNIFKVPPATSISIKLDQLKLKNFDNFRDFSEQDSVSLKEFWNLHEAKTLDAGIKYSDVKQTLNQKLTNAIKLQQLSDVPLGCFLSGGIDSTLIASLMSKANKDTKTFTIGFEFSEYDESIHAEKIAKYLKTDHKTVICSTKETQEIIKS